MATTESACNNRNTPWSKSPIECHQSTRVYSMSGMKNGLLGCRRRSMGSLSGGGTIWNSSEMDLCHGKQLLLMARWHSGTVCHWMISIMVNRFSGSALGYFRRHVQVKFGRQGYKVGEASSNQRGIWEGPCATRWQVTPHSCQIQCCWLWFTGYQIATI